MTQILLFQSPSRGEKKTYHQVRQQNSRRLTQESIELGINRIIEH